MEKSKFASNTELVDDDGKTFGIKFSGGAKGGGRTSIIIIAAVCIIALACLCAGIALMVKTKSCESSKSGSTTSSLKDQCKYSDEAKRIGLNSFLIKVKDTFYKLHPENTAWHPEADTDKIRKEYRAYDPTPAKIKERTDKAMLLLEEINKKVRYMIALIIRVSPEVRVCVRE